MARVKKSTKSTEPVEPVVEKEEAVVEIEETVVKKPRSTKKSSKKGKVVNCGLLNVRENASIAAKVVRCIPAGTEIEILDEEGDFYKIADGFVMKSYIE